MSDDLVSKKNTAAFQQAIKELNLKLGEQQALVQPLQATISAMTERMTLVETSLMLLRAKMTGTGPTVK